MKIKRVLLLLSLQLCFAIFWTSSVFALEAEDSSLNLSEALSSDISACSGEDDFITDIVDGSESAEDENQVPEEDESILESAEAGQGCENSEIAEQNPEAEDTGYTSPEGNNPESGNLSEQAASTSHVSSKPITIESISTSTAAGNGNYTSLEFTISRENEPDYIGYITGIEISDPNIFSSRLNELVLDIANFFYYNLDTYTPDNVQQTLTISNEDGYGIDFIDAEKYTLDDGAVVPSSGASDSSLCWAGAFSDMAELSGWADELTDGDGTPLTGGLSDIPNEDRVFDCFRESFYNGSSYIASGGRWFIDGVFQNQPRDENGNVIILDNGQSASLNNLSSGGYYRDYSSTDIITEYRTDSSSSAGDEIADLFLELHNGSSFGISQMLYNTEEKAVLFSHATALMGYIKEMTNGVPGSGIEALKAIFISDSDNSAPVSGIQDPALSANSITMVSTVPVVVNGAEAIRYTTNIHAGVHYIWAVTRLSAKNSSETEAARESDERATKDGREHVDFCVVLLAADSNQPEYEIGKSVCLSASLRNKSYQKVDIDVSQTGRVILNGEFIVYKDGVEYERVPSDTQVSTIYALEDSFSLFADYTIKDYGIYEVMFQFNKAYFESGGEPLTEAYYINNKSTPRMNIRFSVIDEPVPENPHPFDVIPVFYCCFSLSTNNSTFAVNVGRFDLSDSLLFLNGQEVDSVNYCIKTDNTGNTYIEFNTEYLKSLGIGTHNFDVYSSGKNLLATVRISSTQ